MRLLSVRTDHAGRKLARRQLEPYGRRDCEGDERQPVPLYGLRANPQGDKSRGLHDLSGQS